MLVVPLAIVLLAGGCILSTRPCALEADTDSIYVFLKNNLVAPSKLDADFIDDGELVAAVPKDPKQQIDPDELVFSVLGMDLEKEQARFRELTAHLEKVTGKKVQLIVWNESVGEQMQAMKDGTLHLALLSTGSVSTAVNKGGIVPFCTIGAAPAGKFGYNMEIIVPASSAIKRPPISRGSRSRTPRRIRIRASRRHCDSLEGIRIATGPRLRRPDHRRSGTRHRRRRERSVHGRGGRQRFASAHDRRREQGRSEIDPLDLQIIDVPPQLFRLRPSTQTGTRRQDQDGVSRIPLEGTSLAKEYAAAGQSKFVPISYKVDWAPIRQMDEQASQLMADAVAKAKK